MKIDKTPLQGLFLVESSSIADPRGVFMRCFCQSELSEAMGTKQIVQSNFSRTESVGAVRGLHYQTAPYSEVKLVRCLRGRVWDVAVDLRKGSPTFLHWHAAELSSENGRMFVIPEGFAHGFQVLEPASELLYLHTQYYQPTHEAGIRFDEPRLAIAWPNPPSDLSNRDNSHAWLDLDFQGIAV